MEYIIVIIVALLASGLTFFSGFGLGTLLLPAFAVFFPIDVAIAATAIVHLGNNLLKVMLVGRNANLKTLFIFGIPSAIASFAGASVLAGLGHVQPLFTYSLFSPTHSVTITKLLVAILMVFFALFELIPSLRDKTFHPKYMMLGGFVSGFFGGLSGHQGALRTGFLARSGLKKDELIGTMVAIAIMTDLARLTVYGSTFITVHLQSISSNNVLSVVAVGMIAAFVGTVVGKNLVKKVTLQFIQKIVAVMLIVIALLVGSGII